MRNERMAAILQAEEKVEVVNRNKRFSGALFVVKLKGVNDYVI